jgi:hypothetical protein
MKNKGFFTTPLIFAAAALLSACGILREGSSIPNDPKPVGDLVAQGNFTGLNGKTVTGAASVYQLSSDGTYVVRLEGISVPSGGPFLVVGQAGGSEVYSQQLRFLTGTQNYFTRLQPPLSWNTIFIRSTTSIMTPDYGKAILLSP